MEKQTYVHHLLCEAFSSRWSPQPMVCLHLNPLLCLLSPHISWPPALCRYIHKSPLCSTFLYGLLVPTSATFHHHLTRAGPLMSHSLISCRYLPKRDNLISLTSTCLLVSVTGSTAHNTAALATLSQCVKLCAIIRWKNKSIHKYHHCKLLYVVRAYLWVFLKCFC